MVKEREDTAEKGWEEMERFDEREKLRGEEDDHVSGIGFSVCNERERERDGH